MIIAADLGPICGWFADVCCDRLQAATDPDKTRFVTAASEILYALSGRQFGTVCGGWTPEERPCHQDCVLGLVTGYPWIPVNVGGVWTNVSTCGCECKCKIILPGPVESITEVIVGGEAVDPSEYWVINRSELALSSGGCVVDSVTYMRGTPLPASGVAAVSEFACEIAKACLGDETCTLNSRVTSITRQGVTMNMIDPLEFIERGRTGLYIVDAWLQAVNPKSRVRRAGIFSPDLELPETVTWHA